MSIAEKYRPHYTYDEYCQWEGKWELIEGMPFAMSPAPIPAHQVIGGNLYALFKEALKKRQPYDINFLIVQPSGNIRHVNLLGQVYFENEKEVIIAGTVQDITPGELTV